MSSMFMVGLISLSFNSFLLASKAAGCRPKSSRFPICSAYSFELQPDLCCQYNRKKRLASGSRYSTILVCRIKSRLYTLQLREKVHRSSPQASFSGSLKTSFSCRKRDTAVSRGFSAPVKGEVNSLQTLRSTNATGG